MPVDRPSWTRFEVAAPELAAAVHARFTVAKHHVLATLRADGSPRVSGTEVVFGAGHFALGSMTGARKVADLLRDGRCAVHSNPGDGSLDGGDAKISANAVELIDHDLIGRIMGDSSHEPGSFHLFDLEINLVALTTIHPDGDRLVITSWDPLHGLRSVDRH
jgi:hypothetical protein